MEEIMEETLNVAIGFATGRKQFKQVLSTYIYHLKETNFLNENNVKLHLVVAYDTNYLGTKKEDYTNLDEDIKNKFETVTFLGDTDIENTKKELIKNNVIKESEKDICFGSGYAVRRNIVLYHVLKNKMDAIIFMDDDEYPMAVTSLPDGSTLWSGQHVIEEHIRQLRFSDVTNGYHCGYISPIPSFNFDNILTEDCFKTFIEALSNDILNWSYIKKTMNAGGITYADKTILSEKKASLVEEVNGAKFITGGNLGINLTNPDKVFPFFNPPGARGEDTFLSTCLTDCTVKLIPTYTFHDGFSMYNNLLNGILPTRLNRIDSTNSNEVVNRFAKACKGWIRYKPLYTYITQREQYDEIMQETREKLEQTVPKLFAFFNVEEFKELIDELNKFDSLVKIHFDEFEKCKKIWVKIKKYFQKEQKRSK